MNRFFSLSSLLVLSGCFNMPVQSDGKVKVLDTAPRISVATSTSETKAVAVFDPNSKVDTAIVGPSGALAGSVITLPAGSLAIATNLVVEEAIPLGETSLTASLGLNSDLAIKPVGSGLIIRPSENVDLTKPLTIAMPIGVSLRGVGLKSIYYTIFYKYFNNGELKAGVIPTSALRISDQGLVYFEGYFGAYWLAEVSAPIETKVEIPTQEPIVNKDRISVIESSGVVTEEKVNARAQTPLVIWNSMALSFDSASRSIFASSSIDSARSVGACKLDLYKDANDTSGTIIDTGSKLSWQLTLSRQDEHTLQARFRCIDDQGRLTVSPWSASLIIPAVVQDLSWTSVNISLDAQARRITLSGAINAGRTGKSCKIELTEDINKASFFSDVTSTLNYVYTFTDLNAHTVQGRFLCVDDLGRSSVSPWSAAVSLVAAVVPSVQWNAVAINYDTTNRAVDLTASIGNGRSLTNCLAQLTEDLSTYPFAQAAVTALSFHYSITKATAHNLYGRFQCTDDLGRSTLSPWTTSVGIPAQNGAPVLNTLSNKLLPGSAVTAGTTITLDFSNTAVNPPSDTGMTYQCAVKLLASVDSTSYACTSLAGSISFDSASGILAWTPDRVAAGAYQITVTGTNSVGSHASSLLIDVIPAIDLSQRLFHIDARFADGTRGGQNSKGNTAIWKDLIAQTQGTLQNFNSTTTWSGSNLPGDPDSLFFPGQTSYAIFSGTNFSSKSELHFDAVINEGYNTGEKVIFSSGNSAGNGWTLTNRRLFLGADSAQTAGNYQTEVMNDTPEIYYRFNSLAGNVVSDASGNARSASVGNPNDVTTGTDAIGDGQSLSFNNTNGNGYLQLQTQYPSGNAWTIETWFKYPFADGCSDGWCSLVRGGDNNYHFVIVQAGSFEIGVHSGGFYSSGYSLSNLTNGWHHLAAVGSSGTTTFYIDGNAVGASAQQGVGTINTIGGEGAYSFGEFDEFAIYNTALSASRVAAHASSGLLASQCSLNLSAGSWTHVAGLVSDTSNTLKLYVNGASICTISKPAANVFAGSTEPLQLGASIIGGSTGWNGRLTSLIFYGNASSSNIATNAQALDPSAQSLPTSGLVTWLRADTGLFQDSGLTLAASANGDPVYIWRDASPAQHDVVVSSYTDSTTARPTLKLNQLNGKPVLSFDGVDDNLQNNFGYSLPLTTIVVARYTGSQQERILSSPGRNWLLGWWHGGWDCGYFDNWIVGCSTADMTWKIYLADQSPTLQRLFKFDQLISSFTAGPNPPIGISVGSFSGTAEISAAEVAEIIMYDHVLTDADRLQLLNYLNQRYAITPN